MRPFLSVQQAAKLLNVSEPTVRDMIARGRIAPRWIVRTTETQVRINPRAFDDEPVPLHPPLTIADVEAAVERVIGRVFRLEQSA